MNTTPVHWKCPRCGLADGWNVPHLQSRVWVEASCSACDCEYRVLVTRPGVGAPKVLVMYAMHGVLHA